VSAFLYIPVSDSSLRIIYSLMDDHISQYLFPGSGSMVPGSMVPGSMVQAAWFRQHGFGQQGSW
jgi:hypothetical protein